MSKYSLGTVNISALGKRCVNSVLKSKRLSYGPFCQEFEEKFAALHSCKAAIVCSSGTAAIHTILTALKFKYGWQDDGEVILPIVTFVATANAIIQTGLKPVFVDIDAQTYNLDPALISAKITTKTRAILPVHLFGKPAAMDQVLKIAKQHKLVVVEDCCETVDAAYQGRKVGSFGAAGAFSTNSAHILTTGIGGVITTNSLKLANLMRSLINHGRDTSYISIDDDDNLSNKPLEKLVSKRFQFNQVGFSYRLSELEAALGVAQLKTLKASLAQRQRNVNYLNQKLKPLEHLLQLPVIGNSGEYTYMVYPLVLKLEALKPKQSNLSNLLNFLEKNQIETRPFMPILWQPVYDYLKLKSKNYLIGAHCTKNGFYVGCHQDLTFKDLDYFIKKLSQFFADQQ